MEYLMTYGWAILIISVVLGTLYQMGVFTSSSVTVRVPPGACKVLRTTSAVNLVGQCSGILPKYVGSFSASSIQVPSRASLSPSSQVTISFWMYSTLAPITSNACLHPLGKWSSTTDANYVFYYGVAPCVGGTSPNIIVYANVLNGGWTGVSPDSSSTISLYTWYSVIWSYGASGGSLYLNGVTQSGSPVCSACGTLTTNVDNLQIDDGSFNGFIADVQLYNTSLDSSQVQTLYLEGIGGAPVSPQYLVAWWPLNGDTNDYGGSNNNGAATGLTFVSQYGK